MAQRMSRGRELQDPLALREAGPHWSDPGIQGPATAGSGRVPAASLPKHDGKAFPVSRSVEITPIDRKGACPGLRSNAPSRANIDL